MVFNSLDFLLFICVVLPLYWVTPVRFRWALLLPAGMFFYGYWKAWYLSLLGVTILIDYGCGRLLSQTADPARRKWILAASITANLGLLAYFKYANFFSQSVLGQNLHQWVLPVGISFYTFQSMAYTIDVYRKQMSAERNLGVFASFVTYFPHLVAGPIVRSSVLLTQVKAGGRFDPEKFAAGFQLALWGLFKKVVIADRCAIYVDQVFGDLHVYHGQAIWVALYLFALQIYCDFSGYTDIARGVSRILGIEIPLNFRRPYFATSMTDFWRRWHISLSTWLRDYLYIPLGGNRKGAARTYFNLIITMLLGGLWHGANWTFVVWGAYHGVLLAMEKMLAPAQAAMPFLKSKFLTPVKVAATFHLALLGWLFFRVQNVSDITYALREMWGFQGPFEANPMIFFNLGLGLAGLVVMEGLQEYGIPWGQWYRRSPLPAKFAYAYVLIFMVILFGVEKGAQFIYFQF